MLYIVFFNAGAVGGFIMNLLKVILGVVLLRKMKYKLSFFYRNNKWEIIVTIIMGILASAWKITINYWEGLLYNDLKFNFAARENVSQEEIPIQAFVMFIDVFLPIFVITSNIRSNDFAKYIYNLMKGCDMISYFLKCSIFIQGKRVSSEYAGNVERLLEGSQLNRSTLFNRSLGSTESDTQNFRPTLGYSIGSENSIKNDMYKTEFLKLQKSNIQLCQKAKSQIENDT